MHRSILVLGLVAGCSEFGLVGAEAPATGVGPDILVDPPALTFGTLSAEEEEIQAFEVQNIGDATLHVADVSLGSGVAFELVGAGKPFDLAPGASRALEVVFSPAGGDENFGQVIVTSDDPDTPRATVDLLGFGASPELVVTPDHHVFGDTFVPCGASVDLTLENVGDEALVVTALDYTSGGMLSLDPASLPELPLTLDPGDSRSVTVAFEAATKGSDSGRLDVTSNDPRGIVSADQDGEGTYEQEVTEVFTEPGVPPVDVMLLIDNSCSMEMDNTDDVRRGIPDFLDRLEQTADWQLVEVTLPSGCANGGVLTPASPSVEQLLVNFAFNSDDSNPRTEKLFELADLALGKTGPGDCNEGFLRPGALLHVIVLSDEPEQSGRNASYWVSRLGSYVASPEHLVISGVLDVNRFCGTGAAVYSTAVDQTGGSRLNICNASWGANFGDLASEVLAGIRIYNLANEPDPASVVVKVNGVPTTSFRVQGSDVTIEDPPVGEGDLVEITYGTFAVCEE